ncbi:MAG TPA: ArnT family glycosyltransferase [Arsenophonus sp.]
MTIIKNYSLSKTDIKTLFGFLLFLLIYLLPGIFGHNPWKQDENYSFGIIQTMYETGNWLIPTNAGQPFMEKPPLYYWLATITTHLFFPLLPLHDAARTATLIFSTLSLSFFVLLAHRFFGAPHFSDHRIWIALALFTSAPGILRHSHDMFTDTALITGTIIGLYGLLGLIKQEKKLFSTLWLTAGTVITMLSKGVFIPGLIWICVILAPICLKSCRNRRYYFLSIIAGFLSLCFILPWPILLFHDSPELFKVWFWDNNIGRFLGFSVEQLGAKAKAFRIPEAILLFSLPSGILAVIFIVKQPLKNLTNNALFLPTSFVILGVVLLQISASGRALYLLPFIAPMALLATCCFCLLPTQLYKIGYYFSQILFSLLIPLIWICYWLSFSSEHRQLLAIFSQWLPSGYQPHFSRLAFLFALTITLIWLFKKRLLAKQLALKSAQIWCLGLTVIWGLVFSLFVGWIDYAKGYQNVFADLKQHIATEFLSTDCMVSHEVGESEAPMLYYYTGILHQSQYHYETPPHCRWFLDLSKEVRAPPSGMEIFWIGHRPDETEENLVLYKKIDH